jgi:hypothetical protein
VAVDWRRLHDGKLHKLHASPNQVKEDVMGGTCNTHEKDEKCIRWKP